MSLMLKLSAIALLLSSSLFANTSNKLMVEFLEEKFQANPKLSDVKVSIEDRLPVKYIKGWEAFIVRVNVTVKGKEKRKISQKMIWFAKDGVIAPDLINMDTGDSLKDYVTPSFKNEHYKKENLIYGDANSQHKVAIFSDPLCPFCKKFVPGAIEDMKKDPKKFAVYYYHFPLPSLHPASVELAKAAIAAELQGKKDVVLTLYKVKLNPRERDVKKILKAFNKVMKTNITPADIASKKVVELYERDQAIADELMIQGTPTLYLDSKIDKSKKKYKKVK